MDLTRVRFADASVDDLLATMKREHAVIVHSFQGESFVCDLDSRFGTTLNGEKLKPRAYTPLPEGAKLVFGESTRHYLFYRRAPPAPGASKSSGTKNKNKRSNKKKAGAPEVLEGKEEHDDAWLAEYEEKDKMAKMERDKVQQQKQKQKQNKTLKNMAGARER